MRKESFDWEKVNWDDLIPRLLLYTIRKLGGQRVVVDGSDAQDYVQQAIKKTITGQRRFDPTKDKSLFFHLAGAIRSDISHDFASKRHVMKVQNIDIDTIAGENYVAINQLLADEFRTKLSDHLNKRNKNLVSVLNYTLQGHRPAAIANKMGVEVSCVYEWKRVLLNEAKDFFDKNHSESDKDVIATLWWPHSPLRGEG